MLEILSERRALVVSLWVFVAAFVLLLLFMDLRLGAYDEGIILAGGQLVASGAVPHRDFYAVYGPGQFYILAGLFHLFGTSFVVARVYDVVVRAAIVASVFWILARRSPPLISTGTAVICGLWMFGCEYYLYPIFPVLLVSLLGTGVLLPVDGRPAGPRRLIIAGALTGLSALFRYDAGFFVLAAHLTAIALLAPVQGLSRRRAALNLLRQVAFYGAGTAATFLPPAVVLLWLGAGPGFIHDVILQSAYYVPMRHLPFPGAGALRASPSEVAVYLPFVAAVLATITMIRTTMAAKPEPFVPESGRRFVLVFGLLIIALLIKGLVRPTAIHMMLAIIPSTILIGLLVQRTWRLSPRWRVALRLAIFMAIAPPLHQALERGISIFQEPTNTFLADATEPDRLNRSASGAGLPNVAGAQMGIADMCAAELVSTLSNPGERILVATGRHDKIFINNVALYFATSRLPGTHWHHYDPGLQTRADIQTRIIADMQSAKVRWVMRDASADDVREPNASAISSGVKTLDLYLLRQYRPVAEFGTISVWLRKTEVVSIPPAPTICRQG